MKRGARAGPRSRQHGSGRVVESDLPLRLDRLPWSRWHLVVVVALGITWVLDGLEVTIVSDVSSVLEHKSALSLSAPEVGAIAAAYVAGAVVGANLFGYLTDRFGRRRLFLVTLGIYTTFTVLTGFSWNLGAILVFRVLTGLGIGGEYAAINSAIDELIPARMRGVIDLSINSSYWMGSMIASAVSLLLLDPQLVPASWGWRLAFFSGAIIAVGVMMVRRTVPESPRWLLTHGRADEAEQTVTGIEAAVRRSLGVRQLDDPEGEAIAIEQRGSVGLASLVRTLLLQYRRQTLVATTLFVTQAFLYNAVFFTLGITLTTFFHVRATVVALYIIPFAFGNLVGPWVLGRFFDSVGRRVMISSSYVLSGVLLIATGELFVRGTLDATTITLAWAVIFFFGSAGASAAYLTGSEIFPMETRALALGFVYSLGTLAGGVSGPLLFGHLIGTKHAAALFLGYLIGAALMIAGGAVEAIWGVDAERRSLEDIARPLTSSPDGRRAAGGRPQPTTGS